MRRAVRGQRIVAESEGPLERPTADVGPDLEAGPPPESGDPKVLALLNAAREGDPGAVDRLIPLLYEELHRVARAQRARWHGNPTLDTTSILHEAYVKMAGQDNPDWRDRSHFMAVAATAMRQVLIDHARRRKAQKRGGGVRPVTFDDIEKLLADTGGPTPVQDDALIELDESLRQLAERSARQARVVECRFFGGMTIPDTAEALGVSPATVKRDWAMAQAWLYQRIQAGLAT